MRKPEQGVVLVVVGLVATLGILTSCSSNDSSRGVPAIERAADLTEERVRALLRESPHAYVVAVQEVVDDSKCYGVADGSSCPVLVKIVDFIASETPGNSDRQLGWTYPTMEMRMETPRANRRIGRHRLVVAFPVKAEPGWYGNRVFITDPRPEDVERLREITGAIGNDPGGRLSNKRLELTDFHRKS